MPSMAELIGAIVGLLALAGVGFVVVGRIEDVGANKVVLADQQAALEQQQKDAALSAGIIQKQAEQLASLSARATTVITRIDHAPSTTGCGPVMRDATRGVHDLFQQGDPAHAGRQPAPAVPGPAAGR